MFRRLFHNRLIIRNFTCTFDIISSMPVAKFFKIWSTEAGYDELWMWFKQIRNEEIF